MRAIALLLVIVFAAGCTGSPTPAALHEEGGAAPTPLPQNMTDLKERLGFAPAPPEPLPPEAHAQANTTSAVTGVPIRFASEGTKDPRSLALERAWSFGDGTTAEGATVQHAYSTPGEYEVHLTVTNTDGLTDVAKLTIQVAQANRPPTAALMVRDAAGVTVERARLGDKLTFDASASSDPDGGVNLDWDLGDGTTSHLTTFKHAYVKPGVHGVTLRVTDGGGLTHVATRTIPVDATFQDSGSYGMNEDIARSTFPLAPAAKRLDVTVEFDGAFGSNDLMFVLRDDGAREVARDEGPTPAGAQGTQRRTVTLDEAALALYAAGEWTVEIRKLSGAPSGLSWSLTVDETY